MNYLAIVSPNDTPLYEASVGSSLKDIRHLHQLVIHAALDFVDTSMWTSSGTYLKVIDKYSDWLISGYVSQGNVRFMLLHEAKNEDGIKNFFLELHELYIKVAMNPFYDSKQIDSPVFHAKVQASAKKYL